MVPCPASTASSRWTSWGWLGLGLILLLSASGADAPPAASEAAKPERPATASAAPITPTITSHAPTLREGTEIVDAVGQFRVTGDRVAFFTADGKGRFLVLENLNLQRIVRVLADSPIPLDWRVSGALTEYRGTNYLFVRSAVLKAGTEVREEPGP